MPVGQRRAPVIAYRPAHDNADGGPAGVAEVNEGAGAGPALAVTAPAN